jgi:Fe2+ or Zn2+ uptake regulation protein
MAKKMTAPENKENSRLEDLQAIILNILTYGSGSTSFEQQIIKEGFSHQQVYTALKALNNSGTVKITESGTEYSPATDQIHEWRKYSLNNDPIRGLKVDIYRKNNTSV